MLAGPMHEHCWGAGADETFRRLCHCLQAAGCRCWCCHGEVWVGLTAAGLWAAGMHKTCQVVLPAPTHSSQLADMFEIPSQQQTNVTDKPTYAMSLRQASALLELQHMTMHSK